MHPKKNTQTHYLIFIILFLLMISFLIPFLFSKKNISISNSSYNPDISPTETVYPSGTGPKLQVIEHAKGIRNDHNIQNDTSIYWTIPSKWTGENATLTVSNLTAKNNKDLKSVADGGHLSDNWCNSSGNYLDTRELDGTSWDLRWGQFNLLDADLYFNTSAHQDSITNLHVHLEVSTSNLGGSDYLDIQLQKESSGYDLIQKITSNGNFIIDKDFSSNPADYVNPDGRMCINFYAPSGSSLLAKHVSIDYVYINVTAGRKMVSPFQVNLNVNGTSFIGTWNDSFAILHGPWNSGQISFFFDCNNLYSVSFNVRTNLWINKTNYANSTYIRGSGDVPIDHYWRINFNAIGASVSFQYQNFMVLHPKIWTYINATSPSGPASPISGSYLENSTIYVYFSIYESGAWEFYCNSPNIISAIHVINNSQEVYTANISETLNISCDLIQSGISGNFNLTIYNGTTIVHQEFVSSSGTSVIFTPWTIYNDSLNNGIYKIIISWKNSTAIGYAKRSITVIYPTELINYTISNSYFIGKELNIIVFYNNTFHLNGFLENGIIGANLNYVIKNSTVPNLDSGALTDLNNGNYSKTITLDYSIGNYTLIINASKKWYQNISRHFHFEIFAYNTSANISLPTINGIGKVYCNYTETVTFRLSYYNTSRGNYSFISGANISIYKNSNLVNHIYWRESITNKTYYIFLNSTSTDFVSSWDDINSNITISIHISKYSFISRTITINWDVRNTTALLIGNLTENRMSGEFGIKLNYTNTLLKSPISDYYSPIFHFIYNGSIYSTLKIQYLTSGLWNLSCIFNETLNVSYNVNVKVSSIGFVDTYWNFKLKIFVVKTVNYTFNITENIYYYQNLNFSIIYNRTHPILEGLDSAEISSSQFGLSVNNLGSGIYQVEVFTAHLLNVSHYKLYFLIKQINYQQINFSIQFNVINVTTNSHIINSTDPLFDGIHSQVFVNQSIIFCLTYNDTFRDEFVANSKISAQIVNLQGHLISSQFDLSSFSNYYLIKIDTLRVHASNYLLKIISKKQNYQESIIILNFTIKPYNSSLIIFRDHPQQGIVQLSSYVEWDHFQILFMTNFTGTFYYKFINYTDRINWGIARYVICKKGEDLQNRSNWLRNGTFYYDAGKKMFYTNAILLKYNNESYLPIGNYTVYVSNFARDCINQTVNFSLEIIPRLSGRIELYPIISITAGQPFLVKAKLYVDDSPYSGILKLYVTYKDKDGNVIDNETIILITDSNGISRKYVYVKDSCSKIIINIKFDGTFQYYPKISIEPFSLDHPIILTVEKPINIFPLIIVIIIASIGSLSAVIFVKTKLIDPKKAKKYELSIEKFNHFKDLASIICIILINKLKNQIEYRKILIDKGFDEKYWNAIDKKLTEFSGVGKKNNAALDIIHYDSIKILVDDGEYIRLALLLEEYPSEIILRSAVGFIQYFELTHYNLLKKSEYNKITDLENFLEKKFGLSYIVPYTISIPKLKSVKISVFQDTLINMAREISEEGYFYISDLYKKVIDESLIEGMIIFQTIQELITKSVFVPYEVSLKSHKKLVKSPEKYTTSKSEIDSYRLKIVSYTNKALNAIRKNDLNLALESYEKAAALAKQFNFREEWKHFLVKIEDIKAKIERSPAISPPISTPKPEIKSKYSVKIQSISTVKYRKEKNKEEVEKSETKEELIQQKQTKPPISPKPSDIEEIKTILTPKPAPKQEKYPKIKIDVTTIDDEIQNIEQEIQSIDRKISKMKTEREEDTLTPLEKALKFGIDVKDEDIFEISKEDEKEQDTDTPQIKIINKKIIKIAQEPETLPSERPLTLEDLNSLCPKCGAKISEKYLKLIIKGYEPECERCGFVLKLDNLKKY